MREHAGDKPFAKEGYELMAAAFEVHNVQGGGLLEEIYQESLEIELQLRTIPYRKKDELRVFYKERLLKKRYIPDLTVFGQIVVELKAVRRWHSPFFTHQYSRPLAPWFTSRSGGGMLERGSRVGLVEQASG